MQSREKVGEASFTPRFNFVLVPSVQPEHAAEVQVQPLDNRTTVVQVHVKILC